VPCGDCNACCRSAYFIHIRADESAALQTIPAELRFAAPRSAAGEQIMGYDQNGCCPMLDDGRCSIYTSRPQTCRQYDCRIFAACGIEAGGDEKKEVNRQVRRWQFEYPNQQDRDEQQALIDALQFLQQHAELLSVEPASTQPTQLALLAIAVYELFLPGHTDDTAALVAQIRAIAGTRR
jgi:Fe-S-cluster containining protein